MITDRFRLWAGDTVIMRTSDYKIMTSVVVSLPSDQWAITEHAGDGMPVVVYNRSTWMELYGKPPVQK